MHWYGWCFPPTRPATLMVHLLFGGCTYEKFCEKNFSFSVESLELLTTCIPTYFRPRNTYRMFNRNFKGNFNINSLLKNKTINCIKVVNNQIN